MARDDNTLLILGAAGAVLLASSKATRDRLSAWLAGKPAPASNTDTKPPASEGTKPATSGETKPPTAQPPAAQPPAARPDTPVYRAFRARLPTTTLNEQIWVQDSSGRYTYVTSPSEFGKYGISADMANVQDISWGQQRAFANQGGNVSGDMVEWVRSDTPTGVLGSYPQVPSSVTQALREGFQAGRLVPVGPVGYAVLKQQGVIS
jgi:hypothetical protein